MSPVDVVESPINGVWRVGRAPDPLAGSGPLSPSELDNPKTGNRFDSPVGAYRVRYFATLLDGCYGETLARYRPDAALRAIIEQEWLERGFMALGEVPADWRQRRLAVRVRFPPGGRFPEGTRFLDVESADTRAVLLSELAGPLAYYGFDYLDVPTVRGADRRVTRLIGQWAYDAVDDSGAPLFSGVRYLSRLDSEWECWAVFEDVEMEEVERKSILAEDPALRRVAKRYDLRVF